MLKIGATNRGAADPDIAKLAAELQVESRVKAARILSPGAGRLRRMFGTDANRGVRHFERSGDLRSHP